MKKISSILLLSAIVFGATACFAGNNTVLSDNVEAFSYAARYDSYISGESGGQGSGFVNTEKAEAKTAEQATALAKNEVTIEYNLISVYYDISSAMWMVMFSTEGMLDGCQNVYIDRDGATTLIVYGG